ncbi:MAG: ATP-binding protein [Pseudomonadota bacterium]
MPRRWSIDDLDQLSAALDALEAMLVTRGWEDARRRRGRLVAEELLVNALTHGRRQGPTAAAALLLTADDALQIRHAGPPFDPTAPVSPPAEGALGGHGLRLVKAYAVTLDYVRAGCENVVTATV